MKVDPNLLSIQPENTIQEAMTKLNQLGKLQPDNALLVMTNEGHLTGIVNDGDIRRALLKGFTMETPVEEIATKSPIVVSEKMAEGDLKELIKINRIHNLPVIDDTGKVVYVERFDIDYQESSKQICAVIMAGGEGLRLRPLTEKLPKPMLTVGEKPILRIIIESLKNVGIRKILINIRYLGDIIQDYFKDGSDFNVQIDYIQEPHPMGTAGSLGLIPEHLKPQSPFLVINGDLLTTLNFKSFRDFHLAERFDFTLCGRPYKVKVPFGYPVIEGDIVTEFKEKPTFTHLVNSGIYCLSPELIKYVAPNEYMDMPDLIKAAIENGKRVGVFPLREKFHEIGQPESYSAAEKFYADHFRA